MKNKTFITIVVLLFCNLSVISQKQAAKIEKITKESIKKDVEKVECDNKKRLESVKKLFIEKGVSENDIEIKEYKKVKNVVITKKGKTDEIVVISAHFDKTSKGCGAIDNWTGIVIIANLYKTISKTATNKTYKFVGFGREEDGLIGSKAMVKEIPKEERKNYCTVLNFDSFGFGYPQALSDISTKYMMGITEEVMEEIKLPFSKASIAGASSDSASFIAKKIPAITLHGLNNDWGNYLHTNKDKVENINYSSVLIGYNVALRMVAKIDGMGCQDFRGKYKRKKKITKKKK